MADGRHIENRKYAIIRPRIVRCSRNVAVDVEIRALRGVYTDTYDNGALLHCFMLLFFCLIVLILLLCMYVCYVF